GNLEHLAGERREFAVLRPSGEAAPRVDADASAWLDLELPVVEGVEELSRDGVDAARTLHPAAAALRVDEEDQLHAPAAVLRDGALPERLVLLPGLVLDENADARPRSRRLLIRRHRIVDEVVRVAKKGFGRIDRRVLQRL